jgi:Fe-S cluster assembly iron-binding protein IscA
LIIMLAMTEYAAAAIRSLVSQPEVPAGAGLRISADHTSPAKQLMLRVTPQPDVNDDVIESNGARLFVEPEVSSALSDKTLDASSDTNGTVRFSVEEGLQ